MGCIEFYVNLYVDDEFKSLLPPPTKRELAQLEANITRDGCCRDPIIVWEHEGKQIVIDGHSRLVILKTHSIEDFITSPLPFQTREEVRIWIRRNQLGRRNLTALWKAKLRGDQYNELKAQHGGSRNPDEGTGIRRCDQLAEEYKVSAATIQRDAEFATALDNITKNCGPDFQDTVLNHLLPISREEVKKLASCEPKRQKEVIEQTLRKGRPIKDVLRQSKDGPVKEPTPTVEQLQQRRERDSHHARYLMHPLYKAAHAKQIERQAKFFENWGKERESILDQIDIEIQGAGGPPPGKVATALDPSSLPPRLQFSATLECIIGAIDVVKKSKTIGKESGGFDTMLIEAQCVGAEPVIRFTTTNFDSWACVNLDPARCRLNGIGSAYVSAHDFVNVLSNFPEDTLIDFETQEDGDKSYLVASTEYKLGEHCLRRTSKFLCRRSELFSTDPEVNSQYTIVVSSKVLKDAVEGVAFAASGDELLQYLWGVQIEIYGDDVVAWATDKTRICYFDNRDVDRDISGLTISLRPSRDQILNVLGCLDASRAVTIEVGEKRVTLRQDDRWFTVPQTSLGTAKLPDWRAIVTKVKNEDRSTVKFERIHLLRAVNFIVRTAPKRGIRLEFDFEQRITTLICELMEVGKIVVKTTSQTLPFFSEAAPNTPSMQVTMAGEGLKEILERFHSEFVSFRLLDANTPVEILGEDECLGYVSGVVKN